MPLAHEAGGTEFHPGGKHWESQSDPEWKALSEWVKNAATSGRVTLALTRGQGALANP